MSLRVNDTMVHGFSERSKRKNYYRGFESQNQKRRHGFPTQVEKSSCCSKIFAFAAVKFAAVVNFFVFISYAGLLFWFCDSKPQNLRFCRKF